MAKLQAGAGRREIQIPQKYLEVENFGLIHDPIHARAVAIRGESMNNKATEQKEDCVDPAILGDNSSVLREETIIIVSLEITSMPEEETAAIRSMIAERTGMKESSIWVCVTHSFSSPHLLPDAMMKSGEEAELKKEYRTALQSAAVGAAADAVEQLRPARLGIGTGECGIVANRDIELADGWWIGTNGDGPTNRTVTVLRFDEYNDPGGKPIALISHFAIQSSVMDQSELADGKKPVTSDIAGNACRKAEKMLELEDGNAEAANCIVSNTGSAEMTNKKSSVVMFLIGAAADQAPVEKAVNETFENGEKIRTDLHEAGFAVCDRLSDILKESICEIAKTTVCDQDTAAIRTISAKMIVPAKHMNRDLHSLRPTRSTIYEPDGESETGIEGIRIGDIALLGAKPELTCKTASDIMEQSPFGTTLVCTLVNGASKYMADEEAYERCCYEAQNSPFGRGSAEMLSERAVGMLGELYL